jgi:hypothetical protein
MANFLEPLEAQVINTFATKAPRTLEAGDKNNRSQLSVVMPGVNQTDEVVNDETLEVKRTFRNAEQAYGSYRRLKQQNVERNRKNALIQKKLNNEPPYAPKKLESMGQNWRSNRPTGFLSTMVSRIQPPFKQVVESSTYVTFAKYPAKGVDADHKTNIFREEITKCIRGWSGHDDIVAQVVHENTTFGFAALCWDDPRDWKPEFCRQDYTFFSIETPQEVQATPIWARKRRYQISELLPILEDPQTSSLAGWNIKNLIKALNNATPAGRTLDSDDDARRIEDWIREGSYGASYENDAKYVELGELLVKEPHGKISRFLFDDKSGNEICTQLDRYSRMSDCLSLFSVEIGSGSLMSSRGAGRDLYNSHIAIDKARNLVQDNVYLKGMLLLKKTATAKPGIAPLTVMHPVAYVAEGYEVVPQSAPADVDDFLKLDQFVSGLAEIQLGTFLPSSALGLQTGDKTASEINRVAAIENQIREGILMRWSKQYSEAVARMQRGICHPEHIKAASELKMLLDVARMTSQDAIWARKEVVEAFQQSEFDMPPFLVPFDLPSHLDEDAVSCCLSMLDRNLPPSDIIMMAFAPAQELIPDNAAQEGAILDLLIQRYSGNPAINQDELIKLDWSKKMGQELANQVILPRDQVEAVAIEATRAQIIELQSIIAGQEVPVSPRDNDMVHLETLVAKLMPVIANAPQGGLPPEMVSPFAKALEHFITHVNQAEMKGADRTKIAEYKQMVQEAYKHLTAGMQAPPIDQMMPAAGAGMPSGRGGGGGRVSAAQAQQATEAISPDQFSGVNQIAAPGKPPTAG